MISVGIDTAEIADWMVHLGITSSPPLSFERVGLGQSNLTYLVRDAADAKWVLRRPPLGQLMASAHDIAREARILTALQDTVVPTPRVCGLTRDADGVPLLLMEFVGGVVLDRTESAESLTAQQRRQIGLSLPEALAKIHAVDFEAVGLGDLASHNPYAQTSAQAMGWSMGTIEDKGSTRPRKPDQAAAGSRATATGIVVGAR